MATFKVSTEGGGTYGDIRYKREDARLAFNDMVEAEFRSTAAESAPRARQVYRSSLILIYESAVDSLTLDNLKFMHSIEWKILEDATWLDSFCTLVWLQPEMYSWVWWRIPRWEFGGNISVGGSVVCNYPKSMTWLLYNARAARCTGGCTGPARTYTVCTDADLATYPPPATECKCNAQNDTCWCDTGGDCVCTGCGFAPLSWVTPGTATTLAMDQGGEAPTEAEVITMLRIANHQLNHPHKYSMAGVYGSIFDKNFGSDSPLTETDLTRFRSKYLRSIITAGNPGNKVSLSLVQPACHARASEGECLGAPTDACQWRPPSLGDPPSCVWATADDAGQAFGEWLQDDGYVDMLNNADGPSSVYYFEMGLLWEQFVAILIRDALLSLGSVFFVFLYIQVHTGSFFLATTGFIQILMPFPNAWFTYRIIFQVKGFWYLSTLALYIVLSIGADDLFVFLDHWREALESNDDEVKYMRGRMGWTWRRAGRAMGVTSVTTMMAFISTMMSEFLAISTFGLFAATLVFWDYTLVMTFFASAVAIHSRRTERTVGCCCCGDCCGGVSCCTCVPCAEVIAVGKGDRRAYEYPAVKPKCQQVLRLEVVPPETVDEAYSVYGPDLKSHEEVIAEDKAKTLRGIAEEGQEAAQEAGAGILTGYVAVGVLAAVGILLWVLGYALLVTDRASSYRFLSFIFLVLLGLVLCAMALNLLSVRSQLRQLQSEDHSSYSFMKNWVGPFLSGTELDSADGEGPRYALGAPIMRFVPTAILLMFAVGMVVCAAQLEADAGSNQMLPKWHPLQRFFDVSQQEMRTSSEDEVQRVDVLFGVSHSDPIDRSGTDKYDVDDRGVPNFRPLSDAAAAFAAPEAQRFMLACCDEVLSQSSRSCAAVEGPCKDRPLQRTLLGTADQNCVMRHFKQWAQAGRYLRPNDGDCTEVFYDGKCEAISAQEAMRLNVNLSAIAWPVSSERYADELWRFTVLSDRLVKSAKAEADRDFSVAVLFQGGDGEPRTVRGIRMWFNTSLHMWNEPEKEIRGWYDAWEAFFAQLNAPQHPQWIAAIYGGTNYPWRDGITHATDAWVQMHGQSVLVKEALVNTAISLSFAFGVVCLATLNPLLGIFVLLELCGVVGSVLGLIWVIGWQLGTIESISMTILVGLSVDYVVHFAVHFSETTQEKRKLKTLETVQGMGATVLGGMATSAGASIMLVACWLQFFYKFGIFFLLTILFSWLWAMFVFLPLLSLVGPEGPRHGECCSLRPLVDRCWQSVCPGKSKEESYQNDALQASGSTPPAAAVRK
eukprot:TRINITY_DN8268_c0_g1_i1.p1 TRINITY_DN8268_c0_g1~~TRINITY_DN8268_c0_g1_i1.p1  ORF type:complete len:1375 (+),score=357.87 TRINITY_DN8268_c0_g1_i1:276-4127(+)